MPAKGSCCCPAPTVRYYTMRGCDPATFLFDWKSTNDGLGQDEPPPNASEYETMPLDAYSVVTAGLVDGDYIITARELDGTIVLQSVPGASNSSLASPYCEVGDNTIWIISITASTDATVASFDRSTFEQIDEFSISLPRAIDSFRAIDDDLVFTSICTGSTQIVLHKYDTGGSLVASKTFGDIMQVGDVATQAKPYVSRHNRSYDGVLFQLILANGPTVHRWTTVDLSDFSVTHGSDIDTADSNSWTQDIYTLEHFTPAGDKAFMSTGSGVGLVDLSALDYDYATNSGGGAGLNPPRACRVTDTHAVTTRGDTGGTVASYDIATGTQLWTDSSTYSRVGYGLGDIIDMGFVARRSASSQLQIQDLDTGSVLHTNDDLGAYYVRQHGGVVFASNFKTDTTIP